MAMRTALSAPAEEVRSGAAAPAGVARRRPASRRRRRERRSGLVFIAPWILGFLGFTLVPMGLSLYYSFTNYDGIKLDRWVGLQNYHKIVTDDPLVGTAVSNTVYLAVLTVTLTSVLSIGLALLLNQKVRGIGIYRTLYYLPTMLPVVVSAFVFWLVLDPNTGVLNRLLGLVGLPQPTWLYSPTWSKPALVLLSLWGIGNSVIIYLAGLQDIPRHLMEAATVDGAGWWARLRYVTLPMLSPVIFFNVLLATIYSFQSFVAIFYLTSTGAGTTPGGPANSTLTWGLLIYEKAFVDGQIGYAAAMSWLMFLFILALTVAMFGLSRRWVHYEGERR